jgi:protein phosphatase
MGGVEGGEFAAQLSVDAVQRCLLSHHREPVDAIRHAFEDANRTILLRRQNRRFREMGTTIVGVIIEGSSVAIAHVGDSRAYLVSDDAIQQVTVDHTYVQQLVDRHEISREEALPHPHSHILTQCIGFSADLRVEAKQYWIWPLEDDELTDFIVLCTDGLYSLVAEHEILSIVTSRLPREACEEMVGLANSRGGFDNITVSVIPLHGRLRDMISPTRGKEVKTRERAKKVDRWWRRSFLFHLVLAAVVGFLASALAVVAFMYFRVF